MATDRSVDILSDESLRLAGVWRRPYDDGLHYLHSRLQTMDIFHNYMPLVWECLALDLKSLLSVQIVGTNKHINYVTNSENSDNILHKE